MKKVDNRGTIKTGITPGGRSYEAFRSKSGKEKVTSVQGVGEREYTKQTVPKGDKFGRKAGVSKISYAIGNKRTYDVKKGPTKKAK